MRTPVIPALFGGLAAGVLGGLFINVLVVQKSLPSGSADKFEVYRDLLILLLAGLAVSGMAIYQLIRARLEETLSARMETVAKAHEIRLHLADARTHTSMDFIWGSLGDIVERMYPEEPRPEDVRRVIQNCWEFAAERGEEASKIVDANQADPSEVDKDLLLRVKSNLAWDYAYLNALTGDTSNLQTAHRLVAEIEQLNTDHDFWYAKTCCFVRFRLPMNPAQKEKALAEMRDLIVRPDVPESRKLLWKNRYGL